MTLVVETETHSYKGIYSTIHTADGAAINGCGIYMNDEFVGFLKDAKDAEMFVEWSMLEKARRSNSIVWTTKHHMFLKGMAYGLFIALIIAILVHVF